MRRRFDLWMNGERVGTWVAAPDDDSLIYDPAWVDSPTGRPLSLSLPFVPDGQAHRGPTVRAWFENLLPDSAAIRQRLAARFRAGGTEAPALLGQIGRDCVGALQIVPEGTDPGDVRKVDADPLDDAGVARILDAATGQGPGAPAEADEGDDLRISIAGAQEKTALLWHEGRWWRPRGATPTTHILKLPLGLVGPRRLDMSASVENEWLCAQILAACGVPIAACRPWRFADRSVLVVERFDRRWAEGGRWLLRLPQEDLCQATGTPPDLKYESDGGPGIDRVMAVLGGSIRRDADRATFFRALVMFHLLAAPDGHAKNFSLFLRAGGACDLTPLYDVMSAWPWIGEAPGRVPMRRVSLAMAAKGRRPHRRLLEVHRRHWLAVGQRHGVVDEAGRSAETVLDDLLGGIPQALDAVAGQLPAGFPLAVAEPVFDGVRETTRRLAGG